MTTARLADAHKHARDRLARAGIDTATLDARLLVEWVTGTDQLETIRNPGRQVDSETNARLEVVLNRRMNGESVHRIIGKRAFFDIELALSRETLEPRPDTEAIVELVLPFLRRRIQELGVADLLDLGTGTGAIALALLNQLQQLRAVGVDISTGALDTARENAHLNRVSERFACLRSDWFSTVTGVYDLIVSNPPYIRTADIEGLQREVVLHDPVRALDGGEDGLGPYRIIAAGARQYLREGGAVAVEIGFDQRADVAAIFAASDLVLEATKTDIGGHERALLFTAA
ncbi:peptide chain release factor N(5)-glutamine methyltransferase [Phyllobacterium pellucidum]|uniref:peptide chain release factor N(5)-glutamine methyltransferase n=1 Tax=Phyllobacterium pellucidum TaxID=2740464 RepID=UPI001D15199A|nr:peptide chain release factor N(5)-glutamine methyltransferase [Phyllobacterium sp. T1018]UGY09638.1 peptide chain release factor N(5)-glutamine methyltransferase [Phyllobacterium sp. T1018]